MKVSLLLLASLLVALPVFPQGKDPGVLPVELTYFSALFGSNMVYLNWGTATETNNYGYDVERAFEDKVFKWIGFVPGNGNSFSPKHYTFIDTNFTQSGIHYYRLKQIDTDGAFEFSDTTFVDVNIVTKVEAEFTPDGFILYQNYPNPFNSATNIIYHLPYDALVSLFVYDAAGAEVMRVLPEIKRAGDNNVRLQLGVLPSGIYFYKLRVVAAGFCGWSAAVRFVYLK